MLISNERKLFLTIPDRYYHSGEDLVAAVNRALHIKNVYNKTSRICNIEIE